MITIKIMLNIIIGTLNIIIAIMIYKKNRVKTKAIIHFIMFCIFAFLWSINVAMTFITQNIILFSWLNKLSYFLAMCISISFLFFSFEYPYRISKINKWLCAFIALFFSFITYLIIFRLSDTIQLLSFGLYPIENNNILLLFGIYMIVILLIGYFILIKKYILSEGINKKRLLIIIISTLIPFILGMIFDWYVIYIGKYDFDRIGPIFTIIMSGSIAYLLFKKE